jgi:D-lyxose ketol-isomerase
MRRSEINAIMSQALRFCDEHRFPLLPFAQWSAERWRSADASCAGIVEDQLGWDITDFGSGDYAGIGLFLFTIRNGSFARVGSGGKTYAEKLLIVGHADPLPLVEDRGHHQPRWRRTGVPGVEPDP